MPSLSRHIRACNNAVLPGGRLPFRLDGQQVGWVRPDIARAMLDLGARREADDAVVLDDPAALPGLASALAQSGTYRLRHEMFDVRANFGGPVLSQVDRGALPVLGIMAEGVHLNGLVRVGGGLHLWLARRAADRPLDPGKLDHLAAGGIPAGLDAAQTLAKEAQEEAGLPADLVAAALPRGTIRYAMERPEGLRRDVLHCYDLLLPDSFVPVPQDGEVAGFELWPVERVLAAVRATDAFKFNVNLVLIALFQRLGLVSADLD